MQVSPPAHVSENLERDLEKQLSLNGIWDFKVYWLPRVLASHCTVKMLLLFIMRIVYLTSKRYQIRAFIIKHFENQYLIANNLVDNSEKNSLNCRTDTVGA